MIFCQALFSKFFAIRISPANLERSRFLGAGRNFRTSIGSFRFASQLGLRSHSFVSALGAQVQYHMPGHFASLFYKFFALFSLLYTSTSFLLEISPCFGTDSAHLRRAAPPTGRGRCTIYNKKSICCLHRANGCSLLYIIVTSGHTPV